MAKREKDTEVEALLDQLLEGLSPEEVMGKEGLLQELQKGIMERMLEGELTAHLGYEKHAPEGRNRRNSRNGHSRKRVKTATAEVELEVPRDREGSFDLLAPPAASVLRASVCSIVPRRKQIGGRLMQIRVIPRWARLPVVLLGLGLPTPLVSQTSVPLRDDGACTACTISLDTIAVLGDQNDDGMVLSRWMSLFALHDGEWATMDSMEPGVFRIYDQSGQYLRRIEAYGEGPGEYKSATNLFRTDDGYLIYDLGAARLTWTTRSFDYVRSIPFSSSALRLHLLSDGTMLYNGVSPHLAARGALIHHIDTLGSTIASFGGSPGPLDLREGMRVIQRVVEPTPSQTVLSSRLDRYEITEYSMTGERLRVFRRDADWFPDDAPRPDPRQLEATPPPPQIAELIVDADRGHVWVLARVPDIEWREAVLARHRISETPEANRYHDTVIELFDLRSGSLLSTSRHRSALKHVSGTGSRFGDGLLLYEVDELDDGTFAVRVMRAQMSG